jgi:hypothetical protein
VSFVLFPFTPLILLIWLFSFLLLVNSVRRLSILFIFSKNQSFVLLIHCTIFFFLFPIVDFCPETFIYSCITLCVYLLCLFAAVFLGVWGVSSDWLPEIFLVFWCECSWLMIVNFPLKTAFAEEYHDLKLAPGQKVQDPIWKLTKAKKGWGWLKE